MDKIIKSLSDMLETNNKDISELLKFSSHHIDKSSSFGSQWNSILSTFEIISPPFQTAKLKDLGDIKKSIILNAV